MKEALSRRNFLLVGTGAVIASRMQAQEHSASIPPTVVAANDNAVADGIGAQATNATHPFRGGIPDHRELYHAGNTGRFIQRATAAFFCDTSRYFGAESVLERIQLALDFLEKSQSSDGNIDLLTTNFNSPPDTGFVVHKVAGAANIVRMNGAVEVLRLFEPFLRRAGHGIAKGGIHTPNHRWVVSAALAQINEVFPDKRFLDRIDAWLAEEIDIDGEGQYTERSVGGYNAVCNDAFLVLAKKLNRPALLAPVRKNLNALAYLLHPNGEVVTEFSNRQDRNTFATLERYWFALRSMAFEDNNGLFASMVKPLEPQTMKLPLLMEYPALTKPLPPSSPIPDDYRVELPGSGITRIRRGKTSATVIHRGNSRWISIHHGEAVINAIRFASAFFGKGQFSPKKFEIEGDELCFYQSLEGRYYQPLSDPKHLPVKQKEYGLKRRRREVSEVCTMHYEGRIRETATGLSVTIRATGTAGVPLAVEINVREGTKLSGTESLGDGRHILRDGMAQCSVGNDTIHFGPGMAAHRYVQIRGAEEKLSGPSIYLTAYTPFETTLEIQTA